MALALAAGLVLALSGTARGEESFPPVPVGLSVVGGDRWQATNDFGLFWVNPVGSQVLGASWQAAGYEDLGPFQSVGSVGISALDHVRVPAAGVWYLTVWLLGPTGLDSRFGATVTLYLDDAPPLISFLPGDAQDLPPQLVATVADPLSGLADGTISYRRLDETPWTQLPTAIRVGALGSELAAASPQLKPGTSYEFKAEASDHAGNVAATTIRADGAPMQFVAPGGAGGRGTGGRGAAGGTRQDGSRVRLLAGLAGGRSGGRGQRSVTVDAGEALLLRGALVAGKSGGGTGAGGEFEAGGGIEGRRVRVVIRPSGGATAARTVTPLTTGPGGRFELRLPPGPSRRLTVVFAGGDGLRSARRRLELQVRAAVSLRAEPRRLRTGGRLRLEGRVGTRGARVPRAGKLVTVSYWEREARRWRPVIVTRTDRAGRFTSSYRFRYVTRRARIRMRAEVRAEAGWPYAPGASRPVTVEVRG